MQRIRNPSPPPGFTDFRKNMHIEFLKPLFSLQSHELSLDLFNKALFISSPETEIIHETVASYDLKNTPAPKNLQLIPEADVYEITTEPIPKTKETSNIKEPERSHKRSRKSSKKHKSDKRESISSDEQRRYHKGESSKLKKKYVSEYYVDGDSNEAPKREKRHKSHSHHRNVSESDSTDYYEKDSRKKSHKKHKRKECNSDSSNESYSRSLRDYKRHKDYKIEHDASDSDRSGRANRYHRSRRDHRKNYDVFDSDRSRSVEVDQYHRASSKKDYNSDGSDSRQERYNKGYKQDYVEDSDLSEGKYDPDMKVKQEYDEVINFGPETFYCKICLLHLNGQSTYESHMNGKRHKKNEKAQMVPEILKESISTLTLSKETLHPCSTPSNPVVLDTESLLQHILSDYTENPLIGLDFLEERQGAKDTVYYCDLCDANCMASSVIPHLIGIKHQLKFLKRVNRNFYERIKERPKKEIAVELRQALLRHEKRHGRGNIKVVSTNEAIKPMETEAGPSRRIHDMEPQIKMDAPKSLMEGPFPDFDATTNNYYCKICDAHMNNFQMFESHRRGKRHLKNEKKSIAERRVQIMETRGSLGIQSQLEMIVSNNKDDCFVGLNYVRETHSENGILFLCYVCGSSGCDTVIIDHLLSLKHRMKYLEAVNENGLIPNSIGNISELEVSAINREYLVEEECLRIEKKYGRGKVEIFTSKRKFFIDKFNVDNVLKSYLLYKSCIIS